MVRNSAITPSQQSQHSARRVLASAAVLGVLAGALLLHTGHATDEGVGGSGPPQPPLAQGFDGQSTYVELGTPRVLELTGPMTLEAWIHPRTLAGSRDILSHEDSIRDQAGFSLRIADGDYQVGCPRSRDCMASARAPETDVGRWVHLAGVYDGAHWTLYRDGEPVASSPKPLDSVPAGGLWAIGSRGGGREHFFLGDIRDVRVWSVARTARELIGAMSQLPPGTASGLVGAWPLNEGEGSVAEDATSNGNDGSLLQGIWGSP